MDFDPDFGYDGRPMYYDRQGLAIGLQRWGELQSNRDYVIVNRTSYGDTKVSTVWVGINHNWSGGEPWIFETVVFAPEGSEFDGDQWRYATEEQAKAGHAEICSIVFAKVAVN